MNLLNEMMGEKPAPRKDAAHLAVLIGNPNTGKTSVFNMLTGGRRRVGNYPGLTVEKRTGWLRGTSLKINLMDLPGTYSLTARSPDEQLVTDILTSRRDDVEEVSVIVVVVDACNLARNMLLVTQLLELNKPVVVALNMNDVARRRGIRIRRNRLRECIGAPVIPISARTGMGKARLTRAIEKAVSSDAPKPVIDWPTALETAVDEFSASLAKSDSAWHWSRNEVRRCIINVGGCIEQNVSPAGHTPICANLAKVRRELESSGVRLPEIDAIVRFQWIERRIPHCISRGPNSRLNGQGVDRLLTHRWAGPLILTLIMTTVFCSVFAWALPLMSAIEGVFAVSADAVRNLLGGGMLTSFLADGVVAGVGNVLVFLPQILILTALIAVLEDSGYLARAALIADRLFRPAGLSGHSLVPLLSSFACAVPGILGARTVANSRERLVTIMIAPLMSCSARIPVYVIMVAAFIPNRIVLGFLPLQGLVFTSMYVVGAVAALGVAVVLNRILDRREETTFLLELPDYRLPSARTVASRLLDQAKTFLVSAGTIILASSIVIWALSYFPRSAQIETNVRKSLAASGQTDERIIQSAVDGAYLRLSILGRVGRAIEPAVAPLGWDWRIGVATLASFPAREVFIANLGVIFNLGAEHETESLVLRNALREAQDAEGRPLFSIPSALSVMVFFALCCQCQATVAVIKRETQTWRWPLIAFGYMTGLGYVAALLVYQIASRFA